MLAAVIVVLVGLGLVAYPFVADAMNQRSQDEVTKVQESVVAAAGPEDLNTEKERALAYNEKLRAGASQVIDPFDAADTPPANEEYEATLNLAGDNVMGRIVIPKIDVDLPIYHYTKEKELEHGVGHVVNTTLPIGGAFTHTVLAGHTGLPTARLFDRLEEIQAGDWFVIRVLGEDHAYQVTSTEIVLPSQVDSLALLPDKDLVTLVTCTPYGVNSHRFLVHAERIDLPSTWNPEEPLPNRSVTPTPQVQPGVWQAALWGAVVGGGVVVLGWIGLALWRRELT